MTKSSDARKERRQLFRQAMAERALGAPKKVYAHEQVLSVAQEMAHEVYDEIMAHDNELYSDWLKMCPDLTRDRAEQLFVDLITPLLLEPARATLTRMLTMDQYKSLHDGIYDALIKDNVLRAGRNAPRGRAKIDVDDEGNVGVTRH